MRSMIFKIIICMILLNLFKLLTSFKSLQANRLLLFLFMITYSFKFSSLQPTSFHSLQDILILFRPDYAPESGDEDEDLTGLTKWKSDVVDQTKADAEKDTRLRLLQNRREMYEDEEDNVRSRRLQGRKDEVESEDEEDVG